MPVVLLPLALLQAAGIDPAEVTRCDATDESCCLECDDACSDSKSEESEASTVIMTPPLRANDIEHGYRRFIKMLPSQYKPAGGIKDPRVFKTRYCNKLPRCPFGRKCQHAHNQNEIDFWNTMRKDGSPLVSF